MSLCAIQIADSRTAPEVEGEVQRKIRKRPPVRPLDDLSGLADALAGIEQDWVQISGPSLRYIAEGLERTQHALAQPGLAGIADVLLHHTSIVLAEGLERGGGQVLHQWSPNDGVLTPEPHLLPPSRVRSAGVLFRRDWLMHRLDALSSRSDGLEHLVYQGLVSAADNARLLVMPWMLAEEIIDLPVGTEHLLDGLEIDLPSQLSAALLWKGHWRDPSPVSPERMQSKLTASRETLLKKLVCGARSMAVRAMRRLR